jgi:hypothetical protein
MTAREAVASISIEHFNFESSHRKQIGGSTADLFAGLNQRYSKGWAYLTDQESLQMDTPHIESHNVGSVHFIIIFFLCRVKC